MWHILIFFTTIVTKVKYFGTLMLWNKALKLRDISTKIKPTGQNNISQVYIRIFSSFTIGNLSRERQKHF